MKYLKNILFFALALLSLTSCEEVIELDLENVEPKLVIEANVDANAQVISVLLTKSNGFYEDVNLNTVEDANVILTLADGSTIDVAHFQNGLYLANNLNVQTNDILSIFVTHDNQEYRATATVPHEVVMDSLEIISVDNAGPGNGNPFGGNSDIQFYRVLTHWQDEGNIENFYRLRATVNDTLQTGYFLNDDLNFDGQATTRPYLSTFEEGDTVTMQLMSVDADYYKYFSDLAAVQGQGFNSSTPFNPQSNFDNNALGYFGIFRSDEKTVILP